MNSHSVPYGDGRIRFTVRFQATRRLQKASIHVEPDGQVLVDAPTGTPVEQVKAAVVKRAHWISTHVEAARARAAQLSPREYVSGEALLYLGRRYRLKVVIDRKTQPATALRGSYIAVAVPRRDPQLVRKELESWFRQRAKLVFEQRLAAVAAPLRWVRELPPTRVQAMTLQWGSCSPGGRITLNPALVKAPRECIDYVLLHELCHLQHHNHSRKFYDTLNRHMPRWPGIKERLDALAEQILPAGRS